MGKNGHKVKGKDVGTAVVFFLLSLGALSILPLKMAGEVDVDLGGAIYLAVVGVSLMFSGIVSSVGGFDSSTPSAPKGIGYTCSGDEHEGSGCHAVGADGCGGCADGG
ncbi:hypothetical protein [Streptomyces sp. CC224B]|uniref:hypothetical protein n=1 Tax=Streptomyces sp. CC224B TaxID=3044571 RepID=UPI0024A9B020|nr:hypothetical protein [Streptomyces sp. CC224B]